MPILVFLGQVCQLWIWAFRDSLPSLPLHLLPSLLSPSPPSFLSRGPHPLNHLGGLGSAVSSPSGVWGTAPAPADKRFGVYLSQKEHLCWQQFLCIFIRINLNFCTNTRLLSSRYSVESEGEALSGVQGAPGQGVSRGTKSP